MADVRVRVTIDQRALDRLVRDGGLVGDYMEDVAEDATRKARSRAPISSGELSRGIDWEMTSARDRCTISVGTSGVPHASHYLLGHAGVPGGKKRPVGAALVARGVPFGNVNRRPGRRYPGQPSMFTSGPIRGFAGNNIVAQAVDEELARRGLRGFSATTGLA